MCLLFTAPTARGEIQLDPGNAPFTVSEHAEYATSEPEYVFDYSETAEFYPIEKILNLVESGIFEKIDTRLFGRGMISQEMAPVHVRIPIRSLSDSPENWILAFNRAANYYINVYFVESGKPLPTDPIFEFNFFGPGWTSSDVQLHTAFEIPARAHGYLYVTYESLNAGLPMTIETTEGYASKRRAQDLIFSAVVGLTVGLVAITVFLMATLRRFAAIYYTGAVLCGLLAVLSSERYLNVLLNHASWIPRYDILQSYALILASSFALLFQRQFFADAGGTGKWLGRASLFVAVVGPLGMIGILENEFFSLYFFFIFLIAWPASIPLIAINGFVAVIRGHVGRWPFFLGSVLISGSLVVKVLSYEFSTLISTREASLVLLYAISLEALALALTMFLQVRHLRFEKERALQNQIVAAQDKLKMAQQMSHAAHDIQQPLASLRMALSSSADSDDKEQDFHKAIDYLESIVKRQLDEARKESTPPTHNHELPHEDVVEPFPLSIVLSNMAVMFSDEAASEKLQLRVVSSTMVAKANVFAVMRVVSNLVSNAIRNTESGGVLIGCRNLGNKTSIDIVDTGSGIEHGALRELQKPFVRDGVYRGNGLGLNIVRELCKEHGFEFQVCSKTNIGSRFRIILPKP